MLLHLMEALCALETRECSSGASLDANSFEINFAIEWVKLMGL
jgi:hypothetical protein